MRRTITFFLVVLVICSCGKKRSAGKQQSSPITGSAAVSTQDSIWFRRHWSNPEHYVFDKPSDSTIIEWQRICEKLNTDMNLCKVPSSMKGIMTPYLAYSDWVEVCSSLRGERLGYRNNNEFLLWRMNEMLPPFGELKGEVQRYEHFRRQVDDLKNCWDRGTQWDCNFKSCLRSRLSEMEAEIYSDRLRKFVPSFMDRSLELEEQAYNRFFEAANEAFEKLQMSPNPAMNGSAAPMAYAGMSEELANQRRQSIVPFFLYITDRENIMQPSRHAIITDRMIEDEYIAFYNSLYEYQEGDGYPLNEQQKALLNEKKAWKAWMSARSKVDWCNRHEREIWDDCTNNLKRSHLISLRNRYSGHGSCSMEQIESLIPFDCSDKVLFGNRYDAVVNNPGRNFCIHANSMIFEGLEASSDSLVSFVSKTVNLGGSIGNARIAIENTDSLDLIASLMLKDKEYTLFPFRKNSLPCTYGSISLLDLDDDGLKEILAQNGLEFSLFIYGLNSGQPVLLGTLECNSGFMLTDDGILVARVGSQGRANMARLENGVLRILGEDEIDKLLFSSKDYRNLRYVFDDTSKSDRTIAKIYPADEYIICDQGTIFGDHSFFTDLDGDGVKEQLYLGRPGWGETSFDIMRVIIPGTRTTYSLAWDVFASKDEKAVKASEIAEEFKGTVQLSAKDIDGDGRKEIVATIGEDGDYTSFVWSFDKERGVTLRK